MKKHLILYIFALIALAGCKKNDNVNLGPKGGYVYSLIYVVEGDKLINAHDYTINLPKDGVVEVIDVVSYGLKEIKKKSGDDDIRVTILSLPLAENKVSNGKYRQQIEIRADASRDGKREAVYTLIAASDDLSELYAADLRIEQK